MVRSWVCSKAVAIQGCAAAATTRACSIAERSWALRVSTEESPRSRAQNSVRLSGGAAAIGWRRRGLVAMAARKRVLTPQSVYDEPAVAAAFAEAGVKELHVNTLYK